MVFDSLSVYSMSSHGKEVSRIKTSEKTVENVN
jgi:hypothetical protein